MHLHPNPGFIDIPARRLRGSTAPRSRGGENFQPQRRVDTSHAPRQATSGLRREHRVPAARKTCWGHTGIESAASRVHTPPSPGPVSRFTPMPQWGRWFLLLEIYSMQKTHS